MKMMNRREETQKRTIPIVPGVEAAVPQTLIHMIPKERAGEISPLGVMLPEEAQKNFRGTPFEDLYDEAVNLLRNRNITPDELSYLSKALSQILVNRDRAPFFIRQGRLSDVDDVEGLVRY